jgi:hypothetical protein
VSRRGYYAAGRVLDVTRRVDESYIWPDALDRDQVAAASESEIVAVYPHRWAMPRDTWGHFFGHAEREIGVLIYSGMFLAEDTGLQRLLAERARRGAGPHPAR